MRARVNAYQVQLLIRLFMPIGTVKQNNNSKKKTAQKIKHIKNYGFLFGWWIEKWKRLHSEFLNHFFFVCEVYV